MWRTPLLGPLVFGWWVQDAERKCDWFEDFTTPGARLLEIGSGPGSVLAALRRRGSDAVALDISDSSYSDDYKPVLYDGRRMPFEDKSFDAALLLTMLHHTSDPDAILKEAARVAKRLIIVEDVYRGPLQRIATKAADSIVNLEFFGHPHSNRNAEEWRAAFRRLGFSLVHESEKPYAGVFLQALYVLDV